MLCVKRVLPSKINELTTTLRFTISVTLPPAARITDLPGSPKSQCMTPCSKFGLQAMPRRGCQLLLSDPQDGIRPLDCKQPPGTCGSETVPPVNAPSSLS